MNSRPLKAEGRFWLTQPGSSAIGHGRIKLLECIHRGGSISQAARDMGMSYKAAWDAVDGMNNLADGLLVERTTGGRHGGGTRLTERGLRVIEVYRAAEAQFQDFLARLGIGIADFEHFFEVMREGGMRTSARNELAGKVKSVTLGAVNAEVVLDIGGGDELVAVITNASVENLALQPGGTAYALVKAPWVVLTTGERIKTSARNRLCGKVERVEEGAVNAEVTLTLPGGKRMAAIVTNDSVRELGLRPGVPACALIKASHVIVAVNA